MARPGSIVTIADQPGSSMSAWTEPVPRILSSKQEVYNHGVQISKRKQDRKGS